MKFVSALIVIALLLGGWMPPERILDAQFSMSIDGEPRPTFLNPRNIEYACKKLLSGEVTYLLKGEGKFQLFCQLPVVSDIPDNRLYFDFDWQEASGLILFFILQSHEGQKPTRIQDDVATDMVETLRDRLLDAKIITRPTEGRDAFSPTFRWCMNSQDRNCMSKDW